MVPLCLGTGPTGLGRGGQPARGFPAGPRLPRGPSPAAKVRRPGSTSGALPSSDPAPFLCPLFRQGVPSLPTRPKVGRKTSGPRHWGFWQRGDRGQWEQEAHCGGWPGPPAWPGTVPVPFGVEAEQGGGPWEPQAGCGVMAAGGR